MAHQFAHHYNRDEARALLPQVRLWLQQLRDHRTVVQRCDERLASRIQSGNDVGGETVHTLVRSLAAMKDVFREFQQREIQIKDLDRGLVDFPALIGEREVFLCWEQDEEDIEFWHDLDAGYAGRERL